MLDFFRKYSPMPESGKSWLVDWLSPLVGVGENIVWVPACATFKLVSLTGPTLWTTRGKYVRENKSCQHFGFSLSLTCASFCWSCNKEASNAVSSKYRGKLGFFLLFRFLLWRSILCFAAELLLILSAFLTTSKSVSSPSEWALVTSVTAGTYWKRVKLDCVKVLKF